MSDQRLQLADPRLAAPNAPKAPFGQFLLGEGLIAPDDLSWALAQQTGLSAQIGEILVADNRLRPDDLLRALADYFDMQLADLEADPPRRQMARLFSAEACLRHAIVPWTQVGDIILVATSRPDRFMKTRAELERDGQKVIPVVASREQISNATRLLFESELAVKAAHKVPAEESCRPRRNKRPFMQLLLAACFSAIITSVVFTPNWAISIGVLFALATLLMTTTLKVSAVIAQGFSALESSEGAAPPQAPLPRVSMLVPLYREKEIAAALIRRLSRLTYPKALLEVVLVLEAKDHVTRATLRETALPPWMRVIEVPDDGDLTTKPRAMNYALDFCDGDIVGVWDAEDAPQPDQIETVVSRFQNAPPNVACLQGILDYYNPRSNWMARCFTIEYATWWRLIQPGIERLGLVMPLGGTTLFFRRDVLEKLNGWDAHNVTEDADLGVRLARHGYFTKMVPTTTFEEANCRPWPWVKQRSRWLKGFMITWMVHMRRPIRLLRDLGIKRFLGIQTIFVATVAQFACAPLLWSFAVTLFDIHHPLELTLGRDVAVGVAITFIIAELCNQGASILAVRAPARRHLVKWVPTTMLYYPLGALAAYKALAELVTNPFYWDKTQHGVSTENAP